MMDIAERENLSNSGVAYLMNKYGIKRRPRSEANYIKYNPKGDPFKIKQLKSKRDFELFNLGVGLFLGEGTKKNKFSLNLTNSDPKIIKLFLKFLREICGVKGEKFRAGLNIFDDIDVKKTTRFWSKTTQIPLFRFLKPTVRKNKGGSYKNKSLRGTLTIYVLNKKLKELMDKWCENATSRDSSVGRAFHW